MPALTTLSRNVVSSSHQLTHGSFPCESKQSQYPLSWNDHEVLIQRTPLGRGAAIVPERWVDQPQFRELELEEAYKANSGGKMWELGQAQPHAPHPLYITGGRGQSRNEIFEKLDFEFVFSVSLPTSKGFTILRGQTHSYDQLPTKIGPRFYSKWGGELKIEIRINFMK